MIIKAFKSITYDFFSVADIRNWTQMSWTQRWNLLEGCVERKKRGAVGPQVQRSPGIWMLLQLSYSACALCPTWALLYFRKVAKQSSPEVLSLPSYNFASWEKLGFLTPVWKIPREVLSGPAWVRCPSLSQSVLAWGLRHTHWQVSEESPSPWPNQRE